MGRELRDELRQGRPFRSLEEELYLNIARTSAVLDHELVQALKRFEITPTQYNVLSILRGAGDAGLCRGDISERLVRQVPDVTRLLDRMEEMQLITRERTGDDRRFVLAYLLGGRVIQVAIVDAAAPVEQVRALVERAAGLDELEEAVSTG